MLASLRPAFRRTRRRAALVSTGFVTIAALTGTAAQPGGAQEAAFGAGTGSAIAIAYKVNPVFGNLSFGITAGESVAGHQNTGAQAQSKAVNLGVIGVTLAGEGCNGADPTLPSASQPQPVIVSSDDAGSDQGRRADLAGAISMFSRANLNPFSQAITTVAPLGDPSVALISGGKSTATSGVVSPGVREARAISEIAEIRLLGGAVVIKGMRWEAVQRTGAVTENTGTFSLGSIVAGGQEIALPSDSLDQLNILRDVLGSLGLTFRPPATRVAEGIVFVDPLTIGIVPAALRDGLVGGLLSALQPAREALVQAIFELGCNGGLNLLGNNSGTAVTVLDLVLATVSGAGYTTLELGGVQATTAEIQGFDGLGVNPTVPELPSIGEINDLIDPPSFPTDLGGTGTTGSSGSSDEATAAAPIADTDDGDRGGKLLAIGAGGLLLLLATAEGDRRKMRRAQREILLED